MLEGQTNWPVLSVSLKYILAAIRDSTRYSSLLQLQYKTRNTGKTVHLRCLTTLIGYFQNYGAHPNGGTLPVDSQLPLLVCSAEWSQVFGMCGALVCVWGMLKDQAMGLTILGCNWWAWSSSVEQYRMGFFIGKVLLILGFVVDTIKFLTKCFSIETRFWCRINIEVRFHLIEKVWEAFSWCRNRIWCWCMHYFIFFSPNSIIYYICSGISIYSFYCMYIVVQCVIKSNEVDNLLKLDLRYLIACVVKSLVPFIPKHASQNKVHRRHLLCFTCSSLYIKQNET